MMKKVAITISKMDHEKFRIIERQQFFKARVLIEYSETEAKEAAGALKLIMANKDTVS